MPKSSKQSRQSIKEVIRQCELIKKEILSQCKLAPHLEKSWDDLLGNNAHGVGILDVKKLLNNSKVLPVIRKRCLVMLLGYYELGADFSARSSVIPNIAEESFDEQLDWQELTDELKRFVRAILEYRCLKVKVELLPDGDGLSYFNNTALLCYASLQPKETDEILKLLDWTAYVPVDKISYGGDVLSSFINSKLLGTHWNRDLRIKVMDSILSRMADEQITKVEQTNVFNNIRYSMNLALHAARYNDRLLSNSDTEIVWYSLWRLYNSEFVVNKGWRVLSDITYVDELHSTPPKMFLHGDPYQFWLKLADNFVIGEVPLGCYHVETAEIDMDKHDYICRGLQDALEGQYPISIAKLKKLFADYEAKQRNQKEEETAQKEKKRRALETLLAE